MNTPPTHDPGQIKLSLHEHNVGFYLPPGASLESANLELPYGALISGTFIGTLKCETGSVILTSEARICGRIEADRVYIEGEIVSVKGGPRTMIIGRWLVAASSNARINADLCSNAFSLHKPKFWGQLMTLDDYVRLERDGVGAGPAANGGPAKPHASTSAPARQRLS